MSLDMKGYNLVFFQDGVVSRFSVTFEDFQKLVADGELKSPFIDTTVYSIDNLIKVERYR